MTTWSFVTNYGLVLGLVAQHPQITARDIASHIGITERTVLRIIADLESEGYLQKRREGRVNLYEVDHELPLRHSQLQDIAVGQLLDVLSAITKVEGLSVRSNSSGGPEDSEGPEDSKDSEATPPGQ